MKSVGIICEYNPFHNGHMYQISEARRLTGCDAVVCIMSGSFVQRGDVAVFDKWSRAKEAVKNGADLVIELPAWYVLQSADIFAKGAVDILAKSHLADTLCFGSESGDSKSLLEIAEILENENTDFKNLMEKSMAEGMGYPAALRLCISQLYPHLEKTVVNPNDMLGASYIRAIIKSNASMDIVPVVRKSAPHDSNVCDGTFASSSQIRRILKDSGDPSQLTPSDLSDDKYSMENIENFILGSFRTYTAEKLRTVPGMEDGLENRLITAAQKSASLDEFFDLAASKRHSLSRVRRTVLATIVGMEKGRECDYVRILAMNSTGSSLLKSKKEKSSLPFVTKTADFMPGENSTFCYDILSTDIAALACDNKEKRLSGKDFYNSPVKI